MDYYCKGYPPASARVCSAYPFPPACAPAGPEHLQGQGGGDIIQPEGGDVPPPDQLCSQLSPSGGLSYYV